VKAHTARKREKTVDNKCLLKVEQFDKCRFGWKPIQQEKREKTHTARKREKTVKK